MKKIFKKTLDKPKGIGYNILNKSKNAAFIILFHVKHYWISLDLALFITIVNPGANNIFINSSIIKLILINAAIIAVNELSKKIINDIYRMAVLVIGVIIASTTMAAFLLFVFLYANDPKAPARAPFNRHVAMVMIGCEANITAPLGSAPTITIKDTTIPKINPINVPICIPYTAPATIIGTKVSVIGNPPKLTYVAITCRIIISAVNMLIIANFLLFIR